MEVAEFNIYGGDILEVYWNGSVWVSPSSGGQHSTKEAAMRVEAYRYLTACDYDSPDDVDLELVGEWLE